jgi:hypothetical protein
MVVGEKVAVTPAGTPAMDKATADWRVELAAEVMVV